VRHHSDPIAVKPQIVQEVLREIRGQVTLNQLIVSVAASVPTSVIESCLPEDIPVIRATPNTPCSVGGGMTAVCKGKCADAAHVGHDLSDVRSGRANGCGQEKYKDAVTTPAGCTIDGIMELEEGKLRVTLIKAVVRATQRAKELGF
jgi:pyrroline-5-carboxylate reductase